MNATLGIASACEGRGELEVHPVVRDKVVFLTMLQVMTGTWCGQVVIGRGNPHMYLERVTGRQELHWSSGTFATLLTYHGAGVAHVGRLATWYWPSTDLGRNLVTNYVDLQFLFCALACTNC